MGGWFSPDTIKALQSGVAAVTAAVSTGQAETNDLSKATLPPQPPAIEQKVDVNQAAVAFDKAAAPATTNTSVQVAGAFAKGAALAGSGLAAAEKIGLGGAGAKPGKFFGAAKALFGAAAGTNDVAVTDAQEGLVRFLSGK